MILCRQAILAQARSCVKGASKYQNSRIAGQQKFEYQGTILASGSSFLFVGTVMLVGFVAMLLESEMHIAGCILFSTFCFLTGSAMTGVGLVHIWKSFWQRKSEL